MNSLHKIVRDSLLTGSLSKRLVLLVGIPTSLFLIAMLAWIALRGFRQTVEQTRATALNLARVQAARLDRMLGEAARIPELHTQMLESGALKTEKELQSYLAKVVARYPSIYGSCLAFEPHTFAPSREFYAPYCYWKDGHVESTDIGTPEYNPFRREWYAKPKTLQHALWTEPYFDDGGGNALMTTHSVPFYKAGSPDTKENFLGIATIDISLDQLIHDLQSIRVADTGYAFLVSPGGRYLAYPDSTKVMKELMKDENPQLAAAMMSGKEGFVRISEPMNKRDAWIAYMPVQNGGFTLALVYPNQEIMRDAYRALADLAIIGLIGLAGLFVALIIISSSVTKPITKLASAARKIADGDLHLRLNDQVNIHEVRDLANAFDKMMRDLRMRMEELKYTTTIKERMTGELNAARRIQMSMLPKEWSDHTAWPSRADISLHAVIQPAREIGGDFYDYRFLDDNRLAFLIGDVAGKGVPAALFMAMTQTLFKGFSSPDRTASDIMARVNNALCDESQAGMFVTLLYGVLHVHTGALDLCNAGHPPPFLIGHNECITQLQDARNPALGLMRDISYHSASFILKPGEKLFLYTDGVTEAFNKDRELYSIQRLEQFLNQNSDKAVEELSSGILKDVRAFSGDEDASDDLTILALKMTGICQGAS